MSRGKRFVWLSALLLVAMTGRIARVEAQDPAVGLHYGSDYSTKQYESFGNWLGQKVLYRVIFMEKSSWTSISQPAFLDVTRAWVNSHPGRIEVISMPLLPDSAKDENFSTITSGARDAYFRSFANQIKARGIAGKVIVRLGWEANGNWYKWTMQNNPAGFKAAYRRVVQVMRAVAPKLRFEYNISNLATRGSTGAKWTEGYPGDDVVDVISMDIYDHWNTWDRMMNGDAGLAEMRAFAIKHNKPEAYAEWAVSLTKNGHGDNPAFISSMANWMRARPGGVLYQAYWNTQSGTKGLLWSSGTNDMPKSRAMYKQQFGPAVNNAPTISAISDQSIAMNGTTGALSFKIADAETAASNLTLSKGTSNTTLVPAANITFGGSGANRTVTVKPAANKTGSATISVKVSDGKLTTTRSFTVTVAASALAKLTYADIGSPAIKGKVSVNSGIVTMTAGGYDIYNQKDQFTFGYSTLPSESELTVRVRSLKAPHAWTKAGLMYRASTAENSAFVAVFVTASRGVVLQWRSTNGGYSSTSPALSGTAPKWVRLLRSGNAFFAFCSDDGVEWELVDSVNVNLPSNALGGIALTSHMTSTAATAEFAKFAVD